MYSNNSDMSISDCMVELYGSKARQVHDRCYEVSSWFGNYVQHVIYDRFWLLGSLDFREKSLITITVLAALNKSEQLNIHLYGYVNQVKDLSKLQLVEKELVLCLPSSYLSFF